MTFNPLLLEAYYTFILFIYSMMLWASKHKIPYHRPVKRKYPYIAKSKKDPHRRLIALMHGKHKCNIKQIRLLCRQPAYKQAYDAIMLQDHRHG